MIGRMFIRNLKGTPHGKRGKIIMEGIARTTGRIQGVVRMTLRKPNQLIKTMKRAKTKIIIGRIRKIKITKIL